MEILIKKELSNDRPVIYNGQSAAGGHSFVCDGYDEDGLFHINGDGADKATVILN